MFGNVYRIFNRVVRRKIIVHCVKCFIRKMFCILSIFIVFIADAEFPKAYTKNNNNKCCIIDLLFWFFLFKLKKKRHSVPFRKQTSHLFQKYKISQRPSGSK